MTDYLDVNPVNFIAFELAPLELALHQCEDIVVGYVHVFVEPGVVKVDMLGGIHVEEHLVAAAQTSGIYPYIRQSGQDVVDGCHSYGGFDVLVDEVCDHVGGGMAQSHHRVVDGKPLGRGFHACILEHGFELFSVGDMLAGFFHRDKVRRNF